MAPPTQNGRASGGQSVGQERRSTRPLKARLKDRLTVAGVVISGVLIVGIWLLVKANSEAAPALSETPRVLLVETISIEQVHAYQIAREYTGSIVARRTSELGFELAGKLTELYVSEGDSITAGAALAQIDTEHLDTNRRKVVAKRAQAIARLEEMLAGPREEDIAAAQARVESYQAQVELLKRQTARLKTLFATHAASQDEYEQFAFGLQSRRAQLNEATYDLEELHNGTRKEQVQAQRAVVNELDAVVANIAVDLRKSELTAPFDGTIARRHADEGTVIKAGQPVFRLVEDKALEAWVGLPAHATTQLSKGSMQRVKIREQHFDTTVSGRFPEVDPATRTRTVVFSLDDTASEYVIHGQVVRLELEETVEEIGYWLPITSLAKGMRGLWTSFVVVESEAKNSTQPRFRVERRDIEVLHTESNRVFVRGTLNPGDRVIASGTHRVVAGQFVRLTK